MAKITLTKDYMAELRSALHVATLDALLKSHRWMPGEIAFQGGTCLHLAHGSPRFSEDLDFLVGSGLQLDTIAAGMERRLNVASWLPRGASISVRKPARGDRNPHAFTVVIGGPDVIGSVQVKVELYQTAKANIEPLQLRVSRVALTTGPAAGAFATVPVVSEQEIFADKVFAVGARPYIKPRDIFDLHWLDQQLPGATVSKGDMRIRLATYPNEKAANWIERAAARAEMLSGQADMVMTDLQRWLPASWPLTIENVRDMINVTVRCLNQGVETMREMEAIADIKGRLESVQESASDTAEPGTTPPRQGRR